MSYRVDKFNGTTLVTVADGSIDTTTDLKFIGRNYSGYGEVQNENFLHLLENFANSVPPTKPITGQIWFDSSSRKLKYYDGIKFKTTSGAEASSSAPSGLAIGELWLDTTTSQLSVWNGSSFVLVGPQSAPGLGTSQIVTQTVKDDQNRSHTILRSVVNGVTTAVFSNDDTFNLDPTNPIEGFSSASNRINRGITLNSVNTSTQAGVSNGGYKFWGTATNADQLGGIPASRYITSQTNQGFDTEVKFRLGLNVGNTSNLRVWVLGGDTPLIENQLNGPIRLRISNSGSASDFDDMLILTRTGDTFSTGASIYPGFNNRVSLGSTLRKFSNIHATSIFGNLTGNLTGDTTGIHKGNVLSQSGIVAYDATAQTMRAVEFIGNLSGNVSGSSASSENSNRLTGLLPSDEALPRDESNAPFRSIAVRTVAGEIRATKFIGLATDSEKLNGKSMSDQQLPDTIVLRTNFGDINARFFNGTSTSSQYADLAEIYKTDKEYSVGTVVAVGGEKEVTASSFGDRAIGVISEKPAYLMNSEAEGQAIALKGRVPVMVIGSVKKGDRLVATNNGYAIKATLHQHADVFAVALESNDNVEVKLVESIIL